MASFGSGFVGGMAGGMAIGSHLRDAWDESDVDAAAAAKVSATEDEAEPVDAPENEASAPVGESPNVAPAEVATPVKKKRWAIGEGEHRKVFDSEPTEEDVRQWKFETITATAGAKHANDWMNAEIDRAAKLRAADKDMMDLDSAKQLHQDAQDLRTEQGVQEGRDNLSELVRQSGGTADSYMAGVEKDSGLALSPEQRKVIQDATGLAMDPASRYRTQMRQAGVLRRSNPDKASELEKSANKMAAGQFISALQAEDAQTVKALYNIFPNGHLASSVGFQNGMVIGKGNDGKPFAIPKRDLMIQAQAMVDPDKAMNTLSGDERLAAQAQKHAESTEFLKQRLEFQKELNDAKINKLNGGGASGSSGGGSGGGGRGDVRDIDMHKMGNALKVFGDDGAQNVELMDTARAFLPAAKGDSDQERGEQAYRAANLYATRKAQIVEAYQKEHDGEVPTEDAINNQLAPMAINPLTGAVARMFKVNPADPGNVAYQYGRPVSPAAPAFVQAIGDGQAIPAMIAAIKAGNLDPADRDAWNQSLAMRLGKSGLTDAQKEAVRVQWDADGMTRLVAQHFKPNAAAPKEGRAAAAKTAPVRTADDVAAFGEAPKGMGAAVAEFAKGQYDKLAKMIDRPDMEEAVTLNMMRKERAISPENLARFKELIAKYPALAEQFGIDPVTMLARNQDAGKIAAR